MIFKRFAKPTYLSMAVETEARDDMIAATCKALPRGPRKLKYLRRLWYNTLEQ